MNIEEMMKTYLEKKARIKFRELDIEALQEKLKYKGNLFTDTEKVAIEGLSMGAKSISDMPIPKTNKFHSSTEDAAFNYNREAFNRNSFDIDDIKSKIASIGFEIEPLKKEVKQVEIFLDGLTEKERFVAEKFYIHSWTWDEVVNCYNQNMPIPKALRSLKEVKHNLLRKIERISSEN